MATYSLFVCYIFSNVMRLVGQGELDISLQIADYEQCLDESVTTPLNHIIEVCLW